MAEVKVAFDDADIYERFMGRWSRAAGEAFLDWLAPPKDKDWLDVGCGTGAFSELILRRGAPKSVAGIDPAPAQIEHAKTHVAGVDFRVGDSMAIPFGEAAFDIVVSALVLHFIPDRLKAFAEMKRVTRPAGIVTGYTWARTETTDGAPYAPFYFGVQAIGAEPMRSPLVPEANLDGLKASLAKTGFERIEVREIEAKRTFRDFDECWAINTVTFHPVGKSIAALSDAQRAKLRRHMQSVLPAAKDGSVTYPARAVAFKARKPG